MPSDHERNDDTIQRGEVLPRRHGSGTPRFDARVFDARERLREGESIESITQHHGAIVVRQAAADMKWRS